MCEKYKGQMTIITSSGVQKHIFAQLREIANSFGCDYRALWTGFSDLAVDGRFIDVNNGRRLNSFGDFEPFVLGQPNGDTKENCANANLDMPYENQSWFDATSWFDANCQDEIHSFCKCDENPQVQIRGEQKISMKNDWLCDKLINQA